MNYAEYLESLGFKPKNTAAIARADKLLGQQRRDVVQVVRDLNLDISEERLAHSIFSGGAPKWELILEILFATGQLELA